MEKNHKGNRLEIRISDDDKAKIAYNANLLNISMSEYILRCIRRKRIVVCENFPDLIFQLSKIGNNINQIAAMANTNKYLSNDYATEIKKLLMQIYNLMYKFVSYVSEQEDSNNDEFLNRQILDDINCAIEKLNKKVDILNNNRT